MLKICLCSDNHGDKEIIEKIKNDNNDCDYYFHLGDSSMNEEELFPFISVKGNNDFGIVFPMQRIIEIKNHRILLLHGHGYTYSLYSLIKKALDEKCDVVFFGHTHEYLDEEYEGIRLINPGSCFYNKDLSKPCFALVTIDDNGIIKSNKIEIQE